MKKSALKIIKTRKVKFLNLLKLAAQDIKQERLLLGESSRYYNL